MANPRDEFDEVLSEREAAFEEPGGDDVMSQGYRVMVVLERVRVRERYRKHRHVLVLDEIGEQVRQLGES